MTYKDSNSDCWVVDSAGKTPGVPYGDTFLTLTRYCITRAENNSTKLFVTSGIKWYKAPLLKSVIKTAAMKGVNEHVCNLVDLINEDLNKRQAKISKKKPKTTEVKVMPSQKMEPVWSISHLIDVISFDKLQWLYEMIFHSKVSLKEILKGSLLVLSLYVVAKYIFLDSDQPPQQISLFKEYLQAQENNDTVLNLDEFYSGNSFDKLNEISKKLKSQQNLLMSLIKEVKICQQKLLVVKYASWISQEYNKCIKNRELDCDIYFQELSNINEQEESPELITSDRIN